MAAHKHLAAMVDGTRTMPREVVVARTRRREVSFLQEVGKVKAASQDEGKSMIASACVTSWVVLHVAWTCPWLGVLARRQGGRGVDGAAARRHCGGRVGCWKRHMTGKLDGAWKFSPFSSPRAAGEHLVGEELAGGELRAALSMLWFSAPSEFATAALFEVAPVAVKRGPQYGHVPWSTGARSFEDASKGGGTGNRMADSSIRDGLRCGCCI